LVESEQLTNKTDVAISASSFIKATLVRI